MLLEQLDSYKVHITAIQEMQNVSVIQDIRVLGVKNWRNVAMDREDWWKLLKKARAHTGLSNQ
jgi:hypothetical protein